MKTFVNGFDSWHETHYEIVSAIALENSKEKDDDIAPRILKRMQEQGTGGLYELAQELTDEFEKLNAEREWNGEFFDEIEKFIEVEFKKYE